MPQETKERRRKGRKLPSMMLEVRDGDKEEIVGRAGEETVEEVVAEEEDEAGDAMLIQAVGGWHTKMSVKFSLRCVYPSSHGNV